MKIFIIILLVLLAGVIVGLRLDAIHHKDIITDRTFGVRLLGFLQDFYESSGQWNQMEQEEYEYLCITAINEIERDFNDLNNWWYFQNMVKGCSTYEEFIEKHYDKMFVRFLHNIRKF